MSIEERLARDIAAVTGGVVVTESDLREARDAVEDRVEERKRRSRLVAVAAAAAAVVIPVAGFAVFQLFDDDKDVAPAEPLPADPSAPGDDFLTGNDPTLDSIEGIWRVDNGNLLLLFSRDGTVQYDDGGRLYSDPDVFGTYQVEDDLITVTVESGPAECVGQDVLLHAALPTSGGMRIVHGEREIAGCAPAAPGQRWVLEQVLPLYNEELSGLRAPDDAQLQQPPDREELLHGDWMAAPEDVMVQVNDGGFFMELAPDGSYVFATTGDIVEDGQVAIVDSGTWNLTGDRLGFVSDGGPDNPSTGAPVCAPGDRFEMASVGHVDADGLVALRGTWAEESCASRWAPSTWILFPHGT